VLGLSIFYQAHIKTMQQTFPVELWHGPTQFLLIYRPNETNLAANFTHLAAVSNEFIEHNDLQFKEYLLVINYWKLDRIQQGTT
jgi:hypothetical protein